MNDSGRIRPDQDTGTDTGDAEAFVPPARQAEQAPADPDIPEQDMGDATSKDTPPEPPPPLPGYEHV